MGAYKFCTCMERIINSLNQGIKKATIIALVSVFFLAACKTLKNEAEPVQLSNEALQLSVNPNGGAITNITLASMEINFLNWSLRPEQMPENNQEGAPFQGHFLCYGRWGAPTEGEINAGVPHNGHHNNLEWSWESENNHLKMEVYSPLDQARIHRSIILHENFPLFYVKESFEHVSSTGRLSNIVQHVTLGPPFLTDSLRIFSNCTLGFLQELSWPEPQLYEYSWPLGEDNEANQFDLSIFQGNRNFVSTHIIEDSIGWVIAVDPVSNSFLGYIWEMEDYPWINFWNYNQDGVPHAYGMEFGTTGIGRSYQDLLSTNTGFHGRQSYYFMDAGEKIQKEYCGFAGRIPEHYPQFENIRIDSFITIIFKKPIIKDYFTIEYDLYSIIDN